MLSILIRSLAIPLIGSAPSQKYSKVWCWISVNKESVAEESEFDLFVCLLDLLLVQEKRMATINK